MLRPESRGTVTLSSPDPLDAPLIDPNFLGDPAGDDLRTAIAGVRKAQEILDQPGFARWLGDPLTPGALADDADGIASYIRRTGLSIHHQVSTCRMGADPASVVDPHFRVRGTSGLRVIDAGAMPSIVRAHTHGPVTMLAERASALLTQEG